MVASDTVVGLVGAGILLVALVGVFVYESQQGVGADEELKTASYNVKTDGSSYSFNQGTGTPIGNTGRCAPAPPATECTPPRAQVDFKFQGLPNPGSLHYVVFIEGPNTVLVGEATASGNQYVTGAKTVDGNHGASPRIVISLEATGTAPAPSWKVATFTVSGSSLGSADATFITADGNHTVSFMASGASTTVEAKISQVQNKTGYTYRGWMVKESDAGISYAFVGNFTSSGLSTGGNQDYTMSGTVTGSQQDYSRFIVTIEQTGATIGTKPAGPAVIKADYNEASSPTVQK